MGRGRSRQFQAAALLFLASLLLMGLALRMSIRNSLNDQMFSQLENDALVLSDLTKAYHEEGGILSIQFVINLDLVSRVSGADAILCDADGKIILCSDSPTGCIHQGYHLTDDYLHTIVEEDGCNHISTLKNLYDEVRYLSAKPVYAASGEKLIGIVIVSTEYEQTSDMIRQITGIYILCTLIFLFAGGILLVAVTRRQSGPLRELAKTARAFGHGDLDARVRLGGDYTPQMEELAIAFNNMASSLQKSEYARQEFVANVSHELKTPMTTIGGYIDGILDGTIPPQRQSHYMRIVSDETKRLSRLVRSMLDIAQLQSEGGIPDEKKTRFDVSECAGQMLLTYEQKIMHKGLNVEVEMPEYPLFTVANRDYISQVIYNLLDNAVKFCPEAGNLGLTLREGDSKLFVSVSNTGETIPPEELSLLFDRFHKIDKSRTEKKDGWGLGLYIVKTIVGLHGEDISVTSKDGKTEFTFTLPLVN